MFLLVVAVNIHIKNSFHLIQPMYCLFVVDHLKALKRLLKLVLVKTIGFNSASTARPSMKEIYDKVTHQDLQKFGLIPELVGRLPIIAALHPLEVDDLVRILLEPRNAIIKQYQKMFKMNGVSLEFEEAAIRAIAEEAIRKNTGARGLRAIIENIMLDIMFDIPDNKTVSKCIITEDVVLKKAAPKFTKKRVRTA